MTPQAKSMATIQFNRATKQFHVVKAGTVIGTYKNYIMALYKMNYENNGG